MEASREQELIAQTPLQPVVVKSKTTAILLAVFLTFWTWLYTYKVDSWKFWLNLVLSVLTVGFWLFVAWVWAIIDTAIRSDEWYATFPNGDLLKKQADLERARTFQANLEAGHDTVGGRKDRE